MKLTVKDLIASTASLKTFGERLRASCERLKTVDANAGEEFARLMAGDLRHFPKDHQRKVLQDVRGELQRTRQPRARLDLFAAERELTTFEPAVEQFKREAERPLDPERAWLQRTRQAGCSAEIHLQLQLLDVERRRLLHEETRGWTPTRWRQAYVAALEDATHQEHATFIRFAEDRFDLDGGWPGTPDQGDLEKQTAHDLRRLILSTRASRLPAEVMEAERAMAECRTTMQRARDLHKVIPLNPEMDPHDPDVIAALAEAV